MNIHTDQFSYFGFTSKSRIDKAIKTLAGLIEGISIDGKVNKQELSTLSEWVNENDDVRGKHPFIELIPLVETAVADRELTEDERFDIIWLCDKLSEKKYFYGQITSDIQRLHGVLGGIVADNVITEAELKGLSEWLMDHKHLEKCWPYEEIDSIITAVMADKKISPNEHKMLLEVFSEFLKLYDDKTITNPPMLDEKTNIDPHVVSTRGLCAVSPSINFENSVFCFTGSFSKYEREELKELVTKFGGRFSNSVVKNLDYLVIGSEGNPCWAYACYGRKVEEAVNLRKKGHKLLLVHENDFLDAIADYNQP
jgi:hypothetical protein